jgi:hypothetical protein
MATGYIRNDTANNIATGNTINASDLDGEFDAIQSAMDATTGHTHDGTVGGGAPIVGIGPVQDVVITTSALRPKTDNTVDLGTSTLEFKDLFIDGTANIDTLQVDESATITANLTVNGNTTLGNAATDTVTVTADVASNLIPSADNTYNLGSATDEWANIYIDGTAQVDTLQVDESATITANLTVNGNTTLGDSAADTVTVTADVASNLIPSVDNTYDLGSATDEWRNLYIDGTAQVDTLQVDESATIAANLTVSGNATITTNLTVNGNTTIGNADTDTITVTADVASNLIPSADNTYDLGASGSEWKDLYITGTANIDSLVADTATISAGTATLSAATIITANGGIVTLQRNDTAITSGETLGEVDFQAPNVSGGGDAVLVTAAIKAVADDTFSSTVNKTSLLFQTALDGPVDTRMEITGEGHVLPGGATNDLGSTSREWRDLWITGTANIDSLVADTVNISAGTITGITDLAVADGGTGASNPAGARTNLELGTIATQDANNVTITGGSITGITDLAVADGGTGASTLTGYVKGSGTSALTASATIPNTDITGLGTMSTQADSAVAITGGSINGTTIGATTASTIAGTTGNFSGNLTVDTNTLFVDATNNRVGVGTATPAAPLHVMGNIQMESAGPVLQFIETDNAADTDARIRLNGGNLLFETLNDDFTLNRLNLTIASGGGITVANLAGAGSRAVNASAAGLLSAASDSRLKHEVTTAPLPGLAEVMLLEPKAYQWLDDIEKRGDNAAVEIGFFAEQVKDIIPSAAPMGNDGYYGFYDRSVVAALTKAIQEQQATINALEARLSALEAQ